MQVLVLRLAPGEDLRSALSQVLQLHAVHAACVLSAVGSFTQAVLRFADAPAGSTVKGPLELVSLSGTLSLDGPHLHASVSDAHGAVRGGHVMPGCIVRTTAEIVLGLLPDWEFRRAMDAATGYAELVAKPLR
ncbi:MAG TPA: PPC domain-containing DNA-binding protein [Ramlibacter sp.]|nr:PPC domain-containing DNA-binding protein [Ramlibacter sp.]